MRKKRIERITELLLKNSKKEDRDHWPYLRRGKTTSKKDANKFMLVCILNYQMRAETPHKNARRFAEQCLGDPDNLWESITEIPQWDDRFEEYRLHRFRTGHKRVRRIGKEIVEKYDGDARKIWRRQSSAKVLNRLKELHVGEQIAPMIVGALLDTEKIQLKKDDKGTANVKVDRHVLRVLGRILEGKEYETSDESTVLKKTQEMHHQCPWRLDLPLFTLGKNLCKASNPRCSECYMQKDCRYYRANEKT